MSSDASASERLARCAVFREFFTEQVPLVIAVLGLGFAVSFLAYGSIPDNDHAFPVAGVAVPVWQLVWLGLWTGYTMAIVGQASGMFVLAYSASVLQFSGLSLSPTCLLIAFLNPFGALMGFRRNHQWNLDMAKWLCIGGVLGAPLGPFIRVYWLADPRPFKAAIGLVLLITAVQLLLDGWRWLRRPSDRTRGLPAGFRITTVARSASHVLIRYPGREVRFDHLTMLAIGTVVGVAGAALGIGGGFLLVPILAIGFRLPMHVIVAASIPYVTVLSLAGLLSYLIVLPSLTGIETPPDWGFAMFVASGAILGAWLAAKTQRFAPEGLLKSSLGAATAVIGAIYLVDYIWGLPFPI